MIVEFKMPRALIVGSVVSGDNGICTFVPGHNVIAKAVWDEISQDKIIAHKVRKGELVVVSKTDGEEMEEGGSFPLKVIAEMFDFLKLEQLASGENAKVAKAAQKRLKELNEPEEKLAASVAEAKNDSGKKVHGLSK